MISFGNLYALRSMVCRPSKKEDNRCLRRTETRIILNRLELLRNSRGISRIYITPCIKMKFFKIGLCWYFTDTFSFAVVLYLFPGLHGIFLFGVPIYIFVISTMLWRAIARVQFFEVSIIATIIIFTFFDYWTFLPTNSWNTNGNNNVFNNNTICNLLIQFTLIFFIILIIFHGYNEKLQFIIEKQHKHTFTWYWN